MPTPADSPLRVALLGLRHLHPEHYLPLFERLPGVTVVAAMEEDATRRSAFAAKHALPTYPDLGTLLTEHSPDIAAIFLPHDECPAAAVKCAEVGLHLMVEKPFAASAEGARLIHTAAITHGVKVTTGYCWRFHPVAREIARLLETGVIGRIHSVEGRCAAGRLERYLEGNSAWILDKDKSGGGPLFNLGVHWIDLFQFLLKSRISAVSGVVRSFQQRFNIEDYGLAHLQFENGALGALDVSYCVPGRFPHGRDLYLAIRGEAGTLSWAPAYEGEADEVHLCSDHPDYAGAPNRKLSFQLDPVVGYSGFMGAAYVEDFVASVRDPAREPTIRSEEAISVLEVAEAIYASAASSAWVTVRTSSPNAIKKGPEKEARA